MIAKSNEELFAGLPATRDELIVRNRALVVALAKKLKKPADMDLDDIIQEGMLALAKAVDGYDPRSGYMFITYAGTAAYRQMTRFIMTNSTVVRLPNSAVGARLRAKDIRFRAMRVYSLNTSAFGRDEHDTERSSLVLDKWCIEDAEDKLDARELIRRAVNERAIDQRQAAVLYSRAKGEGLSEIGLRLGISKERVRQVESVAIEKIREKYVKEEDYV